MKTPIIRLPCGCRYQGSRWIAFCEPHRLEHDTRHAEAQRDYRARWPALAALALYVLAALIEPADGAELYASGGLAYQIPHGGCRLPDGRMGTYCLWDRTAPDAILGHIELGYAVTRGRWSAALYARHESQPRLDDWGCNSVGVALRTTLWRH